VHTGTVSLTVELDPTASGVITPFVVSGEGLAFNVGSSPSMTARIGLPNLTTSSLGGIAGRLSSIASGGENTLVGGKSAEALRILDDAISDATRARSIIGGFQKFTLDSASRVLDSSIEHFSSALSDVLDTDLALETALLTKNRLLEQSAFEALAITSLRNQDVLGLLKNAATRF